MSLQAITLAQPWPRMMLLGDTPKRIENREWCPPRRLIGHYLALHGGRLPKTRAELNEARAALTWVNDVVFGGADEGDWDVGDITALCVQGIYAVARLAEVVTASDDPWFVGRYGWVLDEFVELDPPVPCAGQRNLWEPSGEALTLVRRRWAAAKRKAEGVNEVQAWAAEPRPPVGPKSGTQHAVFAPARLPGLFCPGTPLESLDAPLEPGRLYGLAVGDDWVTVMRSPDGLRWRSMRLGHLGQGLRSELESYLQGRQRKEAAA